VTADRGQERWRRISALLDELLDRPEGERRAHLERACDSDPGLKEEVLGYLAAGEKAGSWLEGSPDEEIGAGSTAQDDDAPSDRIGPYRLLRPIGRGGMGIVYLAGRADGQFEKEVALKLIRRGLDTDEIQTRFRRERQILARLEHPHIARLLDGGLSLDGRPYFVMEHVEGAAITAWCDGRAASVEERLRLFHDICEAVQYAHRNLIVHRDLKPSNILVDASGQVKLLDFGIAKLLDREGSDGSETLTRSERRPMTPGYAAPELALNRPVTTASDVYSLGVVLYELLAGRRPGRGARLDAGVADASIEPGPLPPSRAVSRDSPTADRPGAGAPAAPLEIARRRGTTPAELRRRLRGDLDSIVLKALQPDPARRYRTVEALAEDLDRYREGLPIRARRDSWTYRAGKFLARHRFGTAAAAAIALTVAAGVAGVVWQAHEARRQENRAELVSSFLESLFAAPNPRRPKTEGVTLREILDRGAAKIDKELAREPEAQARLLTVMGTAYQGLGQYKQAEQLHERSLKIHRSAPGKEDPDTLAAMKGLAADVFYQGRYAEAETLYRQLVASRRRNQGSEHPDTLGAQMDLVSTIAYQGRYAEAEPMYRDLLSVQRRVLGNEHPDTLAALINLGHVVSGQGRYAEAETLCREVAAAQRRVLGDEHPDTLTALMNLSLTLDSQRRYAEAETLSREVLGIQRRVLGNEHPDALITMINLGELLLHEGRFAEAEAMEREAFTVQRRVLGGEHPYTLVAEVDLSLALSSQHRYDEAERLLLEALKGQSKVLGERHPDTVHTLYNVGSLKARRGDVAGALLYLRQATDRGLPDADYMAGDPDLGPLHGNPEFEALVAAARENAKRR
jgi:serine/threonine protein kinase/effector-binding domain-containing protein